MSPSAAGAAAADNRQRVDRVEARISSTESAESATDTVIIGTGPSALILSFILHGNIPYYDLENPHPDPILHKKLSASPCLLSLDVPELTAHFDASRISYSTQALPVNVLLDTLLRPLSDVEPGEHSPALVWRREPERAVEHVLIGDTEQAGGQWASNPVDASWDIGTLSYLEQLSLPRYTLFDHLKTSQTSLSVGCERPTRRQIADYLAAYPAAVGIEDAIRVGIVNDVSRTDNGFHIGSHNIFCKHLVLASGIFTKLIPPPKILQPLASLQPNDDGANGALLVVGSGFSAADVIVSRVQKRKIIHVFRWQPHDKPSPLQACHPQAYPEYAGVYRQMKQATKRQSTDASVLSPTPRKQKPFFDEWVWSQNYVGLPNAEIEIIDSNPDGAVVYFLLPSGEKAVHKVSSLAYVIGRRGSLDYLSPSLRSELMETGSFRGASGSDSSLVSSQTLREKVESNTEVALRIFAIGSLTGDSLIRFAYGGCVQSAGVILGRETASKNDLPQQPKIASARVNGSGSPIVNGGHSDLGKAPETLPIASQTSRFVRWTRRKSSCTVS